MRKSKTGVESITPRKKGRQLAFPKLICTPGQNCKASSLTSVAAIDSILNHAIKNSECKEHQDCMARSIHEDLLNP